MVITNLGTSIKLTFDTGDVTYSKKDIIGVKAHSGTETVKLLVNGGGINGKNYVVIKWDDVTTPSFSTFYDFAVWVNYIVNDSVTTILYLATDTDESNGYIDLSSYSSSLTINAVMQNSSYLNPSQYSYSSVTGNLTFVGGITSGDYVVIYANT